MTKRSNTIVFFLVATVFNLIVMLVLLIASMAVAIALFGESESPLAGVAGFFIIGVPVANWMGQALGWRWGFGVVAVLALATVTLVAIHAPRDGGDAKASPMRELTALQRPQVWLTLLTGAIGFGGLFAVYTYVASTMIEVTHVSEAYVPLVLAIFGVGMTLGNLASAWLADRALNRTVIGIMLWSAASLALFPLMAGNVWTLGLVIFMIGLGGGLGTPLQARLMDVAGDAQTLAAALHHSAFNVANALGPWLGGLSIAAGHGLVSTGWIGSGLALGGLAGFLFAIMLQRRAAPMIAAPAE